MVNENYTIQGLSDNQVKIARDRFGKNELNFKEDNTVLDALKSLAKEPMIILLLVASIIYFVSGQTGDALFLIRFESRFWYIRFAQYDVRFIGKAV